MNGRIFLAALLSAFAGIAWAGETVLNEKSSRLLNTDGETYVVRGSLTFKGDDGTGQSGLSVAEGVHVKIRIEKDATLTCIGGSGANALAGGDGQTPRFDNKTSQNNGYGISYEVMTFKAASSGAGASQGGGGGAGILVPASSSLTVFGEGELVTKGGAGGVGGKGGASATGAFHVISWAGLAGSAINANWDYLVWSNRFHSADGLTTIISGTASADHYNWWYNAQPASGGGGGGGAGGGGAGIGLPGGAGGAGGDGGVVQSVWGGEDTKVLATVSGSPGKAAEGPAAGCGTVRLALSSATVTGGEGGGKGESATDGGAKDEQLVWCYDAAGQRTTKVDLYMYNGRAGGGGGGGGAGADFGTGGSGGAGGGGGYSGGIAFNPTNAPSWESGVGAAGQTGANGVTNAVVRLPVILTPQDGLPFPCETLAQAVGDIVTNEANYGATLTVVGDVTKENAKVPSGTAVVAHEGLFRVPEKKDLRHDYYRYPVPCETNGTTRTYHFSFDENRVVPGVSAFGVANGKASITVTNVCEEMCYRVLSRTNLTEGVSCAGDKVRAKNGDPLVLTGQATEKMRFYRVGVTDDPRPEEGSE